MITPAYCQTMARYNAWQNSGLCRVVAGVDDSALRLDRGAFFGSIAGTLNHLLWGNLLWMARFDGGCVPTQNIQTSVTIAPTLADWAKLRTALDIRIQHWADGLDAGALRGDLSWYSGAMQADVTQSRATCITHFFNHQTHHRGQIHAMLTAAGVKPAATDLVFMPEQ